MVPEISSLDAFCDGAAGGAGAGAGIGDSRSWMMVLGATYVPLCLKLSALKIFPSAAKPKTK